MIRMHLRATGTDEQRVRVSRDIVDDELSQLSIFISADVFSSNTYFVIDAVRVPAQLEFMLVRDSALKLALRHGWTDPAVSESDLGQLGEQSTDHTLHELETVQGNCVDGFRTVLCPRSRDASNSLQFAVSVCSARLSWFPVKNIQVLLFWVILKVGKLQMTVSVVSRIEPSFSDTFRARNPNFSLPSLVTGKPPPS